LDWAYYSWNLQGPKRIKTGPKRNCFELLWIAGYFLENAGA